MREYKDRSNLYDNDDGETPELQWLEDSIHFLFSLTGFWLLLVWRCFTGVVAAVCQSSTRRKM
jgi:hypothetical protein